MVRICQIPIIVSDIKISSHDENIVEIHLNTLKIFEDILLFIRVNVDNE